MCDAKTSMIIGTIAGGVVGGVPGAAVGASLSNTVNPIRPPEVPKLLPAPLQTMPTMDSAAVARAREASVARLMAMGGRSSTILSQPNNDVLGG